jgi:hypothetical protein
MLYLKTILIISLCNQVNRPPVRIGKRQLSYTSSWKQFNYLTSHRVSWLST